MTIRRREQFTLRAPKTVTTLTRSLSPMAIQDKPLEDTNSAVSSAFSSLEECRSPACIAENLTTSVMPAKANSPFLKLSILGLLAGVYIGFGAEAAMMIGHDISPYLGVGISKLVVGMVFSVGLMLVILAGGELFTGNVLISMSVLDGRTSVKSLLRNWGIVYFTNLIGAALLGFLVFKSGLWKTNDLLVGIYSLKIAVMKVNLSFTEAFARGILCNWLVCLAVWMSFAARNVIGKIFAIFFPITIFVASGFEHSIANMFYLFKGFLMYLTPDVVQASGIPAEKMSHLTMDGIIMGNLLPVTLGNIVGAILFVALLYWVAYLKK